MYIPATHADWGITKEEAVENIKDFVRNNVLLVDLGNELIKQPTTLPALIGFASDEGVRRNNGRTGAVDGPQEIRKSLSRFAWHNKDNFFIDAGSVQCEGEKLEAAQNTYGNIVNLLLKNNFFPIGLGGGHEIAYAGYIGIRDYIQKDTLGIINFDAHFDMRTTQNRLPNSGTSFYQIAEHCAHNSLDFKYLCLGLEEFSNSSKLFNTAENYGALWEFAGTITPDFLPEIRNRIDSFIYGLDNIYLSICMDVFNGAYAPGVSALNPSGIFPAPAIDLIKYILKSGKVVYLDIAELNPRFDIDNRTAKLAALLIYNVMEGLYTLEKNKSG